MSEWTPESMAAHKARLEIIEKLGWGLSSIAGSDWIVERIKREKQKLELQVEELQKYRAEAPEALKTLAKAIEDRDRKLEESNRLYDELKRSIWKHLHLKHERTICPLSVGSRDRCAEIILRDAGLNPADGTPEEKRVVSSDTCNHGKSAGFCHAVGCENESDSRKFR